MKISAGNLSKIADIIEETLETDLSNEDAFGLFQILQDYVDSKTPSDGVDAAYESHRDHMLEIELEKKEGA